MFFRPIFTAIKTVGLAVLFFDSAFCQSSSESDAAPLIADSKSLDQTDVRLGQPADENKDENKENRFRLDSIRGRIVWLNEVLKERFGISTATEAAENSLAILSEDGQLLPIVEDFRGRAFRIDPRLRKMNVELLVRRYERHPLLQILRVYEIADGTRYEVDYWCDVCAIVMFQQGPCACCQDENRLRKRLVEEPVSPLEAAENSGK